MVCIAEPPPYQFPHIISTTFFSQLMHQGLMILLTIWHLCNIHLHPFNDHTTDHTQLHVIVEHIFHTISLDPTLLALLTHTTIDQIMQKTTRNQWKWIKIRLAHIQVHQEGAQQQATLPHT